jgi:hypothetical protein
LHDIFSKHLFLILTDKMGRKVRAKVKLEPHLSLNANETVVLLNAHRFSQYDSSDSGSRTPHFLDAVTFESQGRGNHYQKHQKKKEAFQFLEQWRLPGFSIPFGVAKYFLLNEFNSRLALDLGLMDQVKLACSFHQDECPPHCTALVHPGQEVPDISSVAMIFATTNCMSNYSAIISTSPPKLHPSSVSTVGDDPSLMNSHHSLHPIPSSSFDNGVNIFRCVLSKTKVYAYFTFISVILLSYLIFIRFLILHLYLIDFC